MKKSLWFISLLSLSAVLLSTHVGSLLLKKIKLDVTTEGLYTLSPGSKKIIAKLNDPITLKLFYSKTAASKGAEGIRAFNNYFFQVKGLLEEFVEVSKGKIKLQIIDPRPDSDEEADALALGLKRFNLTETETYFFGLAVIGSKGSEKSIEFFDPGKQESLEYDLAKLIYQGTSPVKKRVGLISSLEVLGEDLSPQIAQMMRMQGQDPGSSWLAFEMLKDVVEVEKVSLNRSPKDPLNYDALIVIHPKNLPEPILYGIDQHVLSGKNLLVLVDPMSITDEGGGRNPYGAPPANQSDLPTLFSKWGVRFETKYLAGDKALAVSGQVAPNRPPEKLIQILKCDQRCTETYRDVVSGSLSNLMFVTPGALSFQAPENVNLTHQSILSTTKTGNTIEVSPYEMGNAAGLWQKFKEGTEPVNLAMRITGKFPASYPSGIEWESGEGSDKNKSPKKEKISGLTESSKEAAVIIIADVDFLNDRFAFSQNFLGVSQVNQNATLFLNAVESLLGPSDLMSVRSRQKVNRSFERIEAVEAKAEASTLAKVEQINQSIRNFQNEINQLGKEASSENLALLQRKGIDKKRELQKKVALLQKELRQVKRDGREEVESLGQTLKYINTFLVPFILLVAAWFIYRKRMRPYNAGGR